MRVPGESGPGRNPAEVPLAVVGSDYRSAPAGFREMLVTTVAERAELYASLQRMDADAGLVVLETCNRVEWLVSGRSPQWLAELLKAQMLSRWCTKLVDQGELPQVNLYVGREGAAHVFRVVGGLESLATGEAEIAGQFQRALQQAIEERTSSRILNGLGRFAGGIARSASKVGFRAGRTRGVHVLAGYFLKEKLPAARPLVVGVAGMGEIGRKTADFLEQSMDLEVVRFNRTIAPEHEGVWRPFVELPARAGELSALVLATGARQPVVGAGDVAMPRREAALVILDLGIPRQGSAALADRPDVAYFDVDDLAAVSRESGDEEQRVGLEEVVARQVQRFRRYCLEREWVVLLKATQQKRYEMLGEELQRFVAERLPQLNESGRSQVVATMKELVREYSSDVFDAVHAALDEQWGADHDES